ncbi:STN domain-containing protein [Bradyrhizobium sp. 31Argb]|uniref:STN domain-containing protein n=1 Tax=unclassified Bradyrhizobium TaxID=2631580 RepID=UPI00102E9B45|nr:STN domain-containing protein [Bradyrhizobium sp. Leo170]TAI60248.1 hypothetical protein CWO89_41740 [Bradyrhizobium sp. Leo170]
MRSQTKAVTEPDRLGYAAGTSGRGRFLLWATPLTVAGAIAATGHLFAQTLSANTAIRFDIPSQSLSAALSRYGDLTGREALYDTSLAAGRASGEVLGVLTPNEALQRLLAGTNLSARFLSENAFVLMPTAPSARQATTQEPSAAHRRYYGLIQETVLDALCQSAVTRPGQYRIVVALWIGSTGRIEKSQRVGSAGSGTIDRQIDVTLASVRLREPPPADFAQPILIVLVPQAPGVTPGCASADTAARPGGETR